MWESMGELGIVYESLGAIGRIFKLLGECRSTSKGLRKFGRVLVSFGEFESLRER